MFDPTDHHVRFSRATCELFKRAAKGDFTGVSSNVLNHRAAAIEVAKSFSAKRVTGTMLAGYDAPALEPDSNRYADIKEFLKRCSDYEPTGALLKSGNDVYLEDIACTRQYFVHKAEKQLIATEANKKIIAGYFGSRHRVMLASGECLKEKEVIELAGSYEETPDYIRTIVNEGVPSILEAGVNTFREWGPVEANNGDILSLSFQNGDLMTELKQGKIPFILSCFGSTPGNFVPEDYANYLSFIGRALNRPKKSPIRGKNRYCVGANFTDDFLTMLSVYVGNPYKHFSIMAFIHSLQMYGMLDKIDFKAIDVETNAHEGADGKIVIQTNIINKKEQQLGEYQGEKMTMSPGHLTYVYITSRHEETFLKEHEEAGMKCEFHMPFKPIGNDPHMLNVKYGIFFFKPIL